MTEIDESRRSFLKMIGVATGASIVSTSFLSNAVSWFMKDEKQSFKRRTEDPRNPSKGEAWIREDMI